MHGKAANLALVTAAQVLALSLWFSGTAAGPGMAREAAAAAGAGFQSWLTGAVQAGFVAGTLFSAALALPDRFDPRRIVAAAALLGAAASAAPSRADSASNRSSMAAAMRRRSVGRRPSARRTRSRRSASTSRSTRQATPAPRSSRVAVSARAKPTIMAMPPSRKPANSAP